MFLVKDAIPLKFMSFAVFLIKKRIQFSLNSTIFTISIYLFIKSSDSLNEPAVTIVDCLKFKGEKNPITKQICYFFPYLYNPIIISNYT